MIKESKMAVMQEMAEIYPPEAEALCEYLPDIDCRKCDYDSCMAFAEALLEKKAEPAQCPELSPEFSQLMSSVISLKKDPIPYNTMMEQVPCELIAINNPNKHAPLLITCNFTETVSILENILTETGTKAFLLPTFTHGYSVDNAVHEKMFKAFEIWKAIQENDISQKVDKTLLVIPGLAEPEKNAIRQLSRWTVMVGPVSGFLIPLFLWENELWH
jgi:CO dehydrogenase/acetyl-CoA synthase gamma subunit (corrinoid Fe-S protein)